LPASNLQKPSTDENALKPSNSSGNITKTDAAAKRRRALGDISNKVGGDHSIDRRGGIKAKVGDTNTSTRKPAAKIWNESVTPRPLSLQRRSSIEQQLQSNKPKGESSLKPCRGTVTFQLPQRQHSSQSLLLPQANIFYQEPLAEQPELEPVDDIEFPAGRSFCDQVESYHDDDDDEAALRLQVQEPPQAKTILQEPLDEEPDLEPVADVEFPAGRLSCHQVEHDNDDDDAHDDDDDDDEPALKLQVQEPPQPKDVLQEPFAGQPELEPVDNVEIPAGQLLFDQSESYDDEEEDEEAAFKLIVQEQHQQLAMEQDAKLEAKINQVAEQDGT
jgi:hypothetical protein